MPGQNMRFSDWTQRRISSSSPVSDWRRPNRGACCESDGRESSRGGWRYDSGGSRCRVKTCASPIGHKDEFRLPPLSLTGDGQIVARVANLTGANQAAEAGVMIREVLDAGSKHALLRLDTKTNFVFLPCL